MKLTLSILSLLGSSSAQIFIDGEEIVDMPSCEEMITHVVMLEQNKNLSTTADLKSLEKVISDYKDDYQLIGCGDFDEDTAETDKEIAIYYDWKTVEKYQKKWEDWFHHDAAGNKDGVAEVTAHLNKHAKIMVDEIHGF